MEDAPSPVETRPALCLLSLGGNEGPVAMTFQKAVGLIEERMGRVLGTSSLYQTPFWTRDEHAPPQPDYLNACLLLKTRLPATKLLAGLLAIEGELGRARPLIQSALGPTPRPIDIDIIDYDGQVWDGDPAPILPHPRMAQRRFVLIPAAEIYPSYRQPLTGTLIDELIAQCPDESPIYRLPGRESWPATYTP